MSRISARKGAGRSARSYARCTDGSVLPRRSGRSEVSAEALARYATAAPGFASRAKMATNFGQDPDGRCAAPRRAEVSRRSLCRIPSTMRVYIAVDRALSRVIDFVGGPLYARIIAALSLSPSYSHSHSLKVTVANRLFPVPILRTSH